MDQPKYATRIIITPISTLSELEAEKRFLYLLLDLANSGDVKRLLQEYKIPGRTKLHKLLKPSFSYNTNKLLDDIWTSNKSGEYYYRVVNWKAVEKNLSTNNDLDRFLDNIIITHSLVEIMNKFQSITWWATNAAFSLITHISASNNAMPGDKLFNITIEY